ncbi:MAG: hypothetical protein VXX72_04490 [Pseudomonadota bacterium]|nr:hypothetical protein [Pseudomonadota bacterium]
MEHSLLNIASPIAVSLVPHFTVSPWRISVIAHNSRQNLTPQNHARNNPKVTRLDNYQG